jgi:hydroxymethylpyrimidine/phosphomethylpyrimidine kinase
VPPPQRTPTALTIAGSDSGGGAGIQADLKAFARCGVHGTSAITAVTAQNTMGVTAIHTVPPEMVLEQVRVVLADIRIDAVKVGMVGGAETIAAVARALDELPEGTPVVVDPVMVAESGARLLETDATRALIEELLPRATVVTPNLPEARALVGWTGGRGGRGEPGEAGGEEGEPTEAEAEEIARAVLALGPRAVVLTGGHRARAVDLFVERGDGGAAGQDRRPGETGPDPGGERENETVKIEGPRHDDGAAHGSGCTHSSVLAAMLARGATPREAARIARRLAGEAVAKGRRDVGAGPGPVDVIGLDEQRARERSIPAAG